MSSSAATVDDDVPGWVAAIRFASRAFGVFAAGLILLSIAIICQMVFIRAVLGQSSIWQTEFVTFAIISATFLGAPYILITKGHVAVDIVPLMVGQPARRALHFIGMAIALAFCLFFLWGATPWWYDTFVSGQTTPSIWQPRVWISYLSVPVGLALLCMEIIAEMYLVAVRRQLPFGLSHEDKL
ncbi:MAG: TRAP transporter small permease [Burkholderiaceae bacterium]